MNRQKLIADLRRSEVREGVPARRVQEELFEALAAGDEEYVYDAAKMLAHFAKPMIQRARHNDARRARHEAYTSLGLTRVRGSRGGVFYE